MLSRYAMVAFTLWLAATLSVAHSASAGPMVGAGNNDTQDESFQLTTTTPPFLVSNPAGPLEHRAAVEFDLRAIVQTEPTFLDARFVVRGTIQTEKDLLVHAFKGDGTVTAEDLDGGTLVSTVHLTPGAGLTQVEFDLKDFLNALGGELPDYGFLGFNLRESESAGGIVTIEYLVLGTFLALNQQQPTTFQQTQPVPEPATMALLSLGCAGLALCRRKRHAVAHN